MALLSLERHAEAGLVFEAIIDSDPTAADSWAALGICMAALAQPEAAVACQRQVLALRTAEAESGISDRIGTRGVQIASEVDDGTDGDV